MEQRKLHLSSREIECNIYELILIVFLFSDYKEYHTDTTVKFVVTLTAEKMEEARAAGIHKKFKLESAINTSNMVSKVNVLFCEVFLLERFCLTPMVV